MQTLKQMPLDHIIAIISAIQTRTSLEGNKQEIKAIHNCSTLRNGGGRDRKTSAHLQDDL